MEFNYLYGKQAEQFSFVNIPKALIKEEAFSNVSLEAKMLYGLILERMGMYKKNNWQDAETNKVDVMDVYHLWVFPKGFSMPFGIHPTKDKQCRVVNRGCPKDPTQLALNSQGMLSNTKDRNESKTFLSHRRRLPPLQVASKK